MLISRELGLVLGFGRGTADATAPMTPETDLHRLFVDGADFPPKSDPSSPELWVGSGLGAGAEGGRR